MKTASPIWFSRMAPCMPPPLGYAVAVTVLDVSHPAEILPLIKGIIMVVPRTCGDEPVDGLTERVTDVRAPHTRGSSD